MSPREQIEMALNAQAWEEAALFVRNGRIGMPFLQQVTLDVSDPQPRPGQQVRILWRVMCRRPRPVSLSIDGHVLRQDAEGELLLRATDQPMDIRLEVDGREVRRIEIRPVVHIPELIGLMVPVQGFNDEDYLLQWITCQHVERMEAILAPDSPEQRLIPVAPGRNGLNIGLLPLGKHRLNLRLIGPDAAYSRQSHRVLNFEIEIQERPPLIEGGLDEESLELGGFTTLRWQVTGAAEIFLEFPDGVARLVDPVGSLQVSGESCGPHCWHLIARTQGGAETLAQFGLLITAPPVLLDISLEPGPDDNGIFLYFTCRNATRLELQLPDRNNEVTSLPHAGRLELDTLVTEHFRFVAEAADGQLVSHVVYMKPPALRLTSLPEAMRPHESVLSYQPQQLFSL